MTILKPYLSYSVLCFMLFFNMGCNDTPDAIIPLACQDQTKLKLPTDYKKSQLFSLVFLDYTDPAIMGTGAKQKLKQVLDHFLITPGDKVQIYFITSNTATHQTSPKATFTLDIPPCKDFIPEATTDSIHKTKIYACARLQKLATINEAIDELLENQKNNSETSNYENSDIAGLLAVADEQFSNYTSKLITKNILVISDMEQNCPGYFRLANTKFISKKNIGQGDPDLDFQTISDQVNIANFKGVRLMQDVGDTPEQKANSEAQTKLKIYWDKLFRSFGMNRISL